MQKTGPAGEQMKTDKSPKQLATGVYTQTDTALGLTEKGVVGFTEHGRRRLLQ